MCWYFTDSQHTQMVYCQLALFYIWQQRMTGLLLRVFIMNDMKRTVKIHPGPTNKVRIFKAREHEARWGTVCCATCFSSSDLEQYGTVQACTVPSLVYLTHWPGPGLKVLWLMPDTRLGQSWENLKSSLHYVPAIILIYITVTSNARHTLQLWPSKLPF